MTNLRINKITCLLSVAFTCLILSFLVLSSSRTSSIYTRSRIFSVQRSLTQLDSTTQIPGAYLEQYSPDLTNTSYCNFNYGFPEDLKYVNADVDSGPELGKSTPYRILYNVAEAKMSAEVPPITYATHVTADFMNYIPELVRYWDGLISVAAFVPDTDVATVLEQLNQYCYCLPEMSRVSFHLVFDKTIPPSRKDVYFTRPTTCEIVDSSTLHTYRSADEKVMYPINVCRNAARTAALTEQILVSDIQLMPSKDLARKFLDMTDTYKLSDCPHRVFVVPVFEVESFEEIPRTKRELLELIHDERAVYFHRLICPHCQRFPGIESWMVTDPGDVIKPLLTARREVPYNRWEPIYIGTKNEPLYNEKLSWEGLQDKMLQTLEMCLIGYKFVILDGAFLVHWPGMKKTKTKDSEAWRDDFVKQNAKEYQNILKNLTIKYPPRPQCKAH